MDIKDSDEVLGSRNSNTWAQCCHLDITSTKQAKNGWRHITRSVSKYSAGLQIGHGQRAWPALSLEAQWDEKLGFRIQESGWMAWRRLSHVNNERHQTLARCTHLSYEWEMAV